LAIIRPGKPPVSTPLKRCVSSKPKPIRLLPETLNEMGEIEGENMCKLNVVAIGDSLTWGYPFGPEASWLHLAALATRIKTANKGISGETTGEMLDRFEEDVISLNPGVVTILGGTNDAWAGIAVHQVKNNIRLMVSKARQAGIFTVIILPPPICRGEGEISLAFLEEMAILLSGYRDAYQDLAAANGLKILDFYTPLLDSKTGWGEERYFIDEAHPNRRGYQIMAGAAIKLFRTLF